MARNGKLDALKPSMNGDIDKKKKKKKAAPRKAIPDAQVFLSYMPKLVDNMFGEGEKSYTLRSSTSRALSGLLGQLETTLTNDAKRVATFQKKKSKALGGVPRLMMWLFSPTHPFLSTSQQQISRQATGQCS